MQNFQNHFKAIFFISCVVVCFNSSLSAQSNYCGTTLPVTPEIAPSNSGAGCYPDITGPFSIRIYAHVIRASNGTGGQSEAAIKQAIETMRSDFAPHNIFFAWDACGINVIPNDILYTTVFPSLSSLLTTYGHQDGINLFFFPTEEGLNPLGQDTLPGKALFIGGEYHTWDGEVFPTINTKTMVRKEIGFADLISY